MFDYSMSGVLLTKVTSTKDLGVIFDSKLTFTDQCCAVVNKAYHRANMLLKCFHSRDRNLQMQLFNTFVRPILEYNSPLASMVSSPSKKYRCIRKSSKILYKKTKRIKK